MIVSAHNASSESIELAWLLPASLETMNGEFLGYQLTYRPATSDPADWSEADLHGTDVTVSSPPRPRPTAPARSGQVGSLGGGAPPARGRCSDGRRPETLHHTARPSE